MITSKNNPKILNLENYSPFKLLFIGLVIAFFIIYPNLSFYSLERDYLGESKESAHLRFFLFRYFFFALLTWILVLFNLKRIETPILQKRLLYTFLLSLAAYVIYFGASHYFNPKPDWHSGLLFLQFFVIFIFCTLTGHLFFLYSERRKKEQEIEQLKVENLQSRYDALTNQIHPHFFFNSLNGLTSLIRKEDKQLTLGYVDKMSDVFRYILQSENKGLIPLEEELEFIQSLSFMLEVRFANKLLFDLQVAEQSLNYKIPVLSLLPVIDNVVVHNTIDSDHKMSVTIETNDLPELVISNPVYPKIDKPLTNGTGLKNLEKRFTLLMNKNIRVENNGHLFRVYLPLKQE